MSNTTQFQARYTLQARSLLLLMLLFLAVVPAGAEEGWLLRFGGAWVQPNFDLDDDDGGLQVDDEDSLGLQLSLERKFSRRLGVELGVTRAESEFGFEAEILSALNFRSDTEVDFTSLTAGLNVHLTPDGPVDLYLGPLVAYTDFGDVDFINALGDQVQSGTVEGADSFAFGAQLGADIRFGESPWSLNLAARYIDTDLEIEDNEGSDLQFDPLIVNFGFGYRF